MENLALIHKEWVSAKERAALICERAGFKDMANTLRKCAMFRGDESLEELIELVFSPQGIEFMTSFGFPTLSLFRSFKKYNLRAHGIYVDAENIILEEQQRVLLVGKTTATIKYFKTCGNNVCAIHGASARIEAAGYSVVKVDKDKHSNIYVDATDHAFII